VSAAEEVYRIGDMVERSTSVVNIEQPWKPFRRTSELRVFSSAAKVSKYEDFWNIGISIKGILVH